VRYFFGLILRSLELIRTRQNLRGFTSIYGHAPARHHGVTPGGAFFAWSVLIKVMKKLGMTMPAWVFSTNAAFWKPL
jgi:hypothetical protein